MQIRLDHINLTTRNLRESMEWYEKLFGFSFKEGNVNDPKEPWAIIGRDDTMLCLYEDKNLRPASETGEGPFHRVYHFGIRVSDQREWEKRIEETGVTVLYGGAYRYPHSLSWYILDPSGHEIEVSYAGDAPLKFP